MNVAKCRHTDIVQGKTKSREALTFMMLPRKSE